MQLGLPLNNNDLFLKNFCHDFIKISSSRDNIFIRRNLRLTSFKKYLLGSFITQSVLEKKSTNFLKKSLKNSSNFAESLIFRKKFMQFYNLKNLTKLKLLLKKNPSANLTQIIKYSSSNLLFREGFLISSKSNFSKSIYWKNKKNLGIKFSINRNLSNSTIFFKGILNSENVYRRRILIRLRVKNKVKSKRFSKIKKGSKIIKKYKKIFKIKRWIKLKKILSKSLIWKKKNFLKKKKLMKKNKGRKKELLKRNFFINQNIRNFFYKKQPIFYSIQKDLFLSNRFT